MPQSEKKRLKRLLIGSGIFIAAGVAYGIFCMLTGFGIPCVFHLITGLKCPGCGITTMFVKLMRLDFAGAFKANPVLLILLPFGAVYAAYLAYRYVKRGKVVPGKFESGCLVFVIVILLGFGIVRNIIGI